MAVTSKQFKRRMRAFEQRAENLKFDKGRLARLMGWEYTSSYPDCYWRWSKVVKGKMLTTGNVDEALRVEASL